MPLSPHLPPKVLEAIDAIREVVQLDLPTTDEADARETFDSNGGWLLAIDDGYFLATENADLVKRLRGEAFMARCEELEIWDETRLPA